MINVDFLDKREDVIFKLKYYGPLMLVVLMCVHPAFSSEDMEGEITPVVLEEMPAIRPSPEIRVWQKPDYSNQEGTLGYQPTTFAVPVGLEERVAFWKDIYSKYTTDQGVLHDSRMVTLVYEVIDFTDISQKTSLSKYRKIKARERRVRNAKKRVRARLRKLQLVRSPEKLSGEDLRLWNLFKNVEDRNKFQIAARRGRLRFQLGQRDRFMEGIYHSGSYIRRMEEIFRSQGLPIELTRIPFVESSFNIKARSRVGASGIWQFMRRTGRSYMTVNRAVDERNDPITATRSAARLLRQNYKMLKSWPLAITGYNHGAYGVRRLVRKMGTRDIVTLVDRGKKVNFGFASQNFYATFLAAVETEKEASRYFGPLQYGPEIKDERIKLRKALPYRTLLSWFDGDREQAKFYNPHLNSRVRKGYWLIPHKTKISIPVEKKTEVLAFFGNQKRSKPAKRKSSSSVAMTVYRVVRGDTLSHIARNFGVTIRTLKQVNGLNHPRNLRAGQTLVIPQNN